MQVKNWMVKKVITIPPHCALVEALTLMKQYSIRHLPVVENKVLLGLISESDLRQCLLSSSLMEEMSLNQIMIKNPITIGSNESMEEAARLIYRYKIGGLPVVDRGKLVGILTTPDILAAFIQLMGVLEASSTLDIQLAPRPKSFEEASGLIQKKGGEIISVGMVGKGKKKTYLFRLKRTPLAPIIQALEKDDHKVISSEE
ncbi:MAG TPA: CBS and ACT domain-containing protein [Thermodesulfobacteriota bacterium]|nr:CBS and ACT domain-containing protein [Thermodesulfobacteriota bacterium]